MPEFRAGLIIRQGILLPEFAHLYPVRTGEWMAAKVLAEYVRAERLRRGETPFELGERVLDPRHFEFRHGAIPRKPPGRWSTRRRPTNVLLMIEPQLDPPPPLF